MYPVDRRLSPADSSLHRSAQHASGSDRADQCAGNADLGSARSSHERFSPRRWPVPPAEPPQLVFVMKVLPGLGAATVIHELSIQLVSAWHDTSGIELIAAVLAVAYLLLAIRPAARAAGPAAFVSSCLYVWVLFTRAPVHGVGAERVLRRDGGVRLLAVAAGQGRRRPCGVALAADAARDRLARASLRCRR